MASTRENVTNTSASETDRLVQSDAEPRPNILVISSDYPAEIVAQGMNLNANRTELPFGKVAGRTADIASFDIVVCPLLGTGFDCVDVAQIIVKFGFQGVLRIVAVDCIDTSVVKKDLQQDFPNLKITICAVG